MGLNLLLNLQARQFWQELSSSWDGHAGSSMQTVLCLNFFDDAHYYYLD